MNVVNESLKELNGTLLVVEDRGHLQAWHDPIGLLMQDSTDFL